MASVPRWLGIGLIGALVLACSEDSETGTSTTTTTTTTVGPGGSGGAGAGGGGAPNECSVAEDCPMQRGPCAERVCEGRVVAVLEGGYDLDGVGGGAAMVLAALDAAERGTLDVAAYESGAQSAQDAVILPAAAAAIEAVLAVHRRGDA